MKKKTEEQADRELLEEMLIKPSNSQLEKNIELLTRDIIEIKATLRAISDGQRRRDVQHDRLLSVLESNNCGGVMVKDEAPRVEPIFVRYTSYQDRTERIERGRVFRREALKTIEEKIQTHHIHHGPIHNGELMTIELMEDKDDERSALVFDYLFRGAKAYDICIAHLFGRYVVTDVFYEEDANELCFFDRIGPLFKTVTRKKIMVTLTKVM